MNHLVLLTVLVSLHMEYCAGQCPRGWKQHVESCYLLIKEPYTWFDAKVACDTTGSSLVEVNSADENMFVASLLNSTNIPNIWIGLEDFVVESEYRWAGSKVGVEFTNWKPGEPNDNHGEEDCVEMDRAGGWNDAHCENHKFAFVCESTDMENIVG